jgi:hypothetical protein
MKGKPTDKTLKRLTDAYREACRDKDHELAASLNGQITACHRRIAEQESLNPTGACACVGPQNGEKLCPCAMRRAQETK